MLENLMYSYNVQLIFTYLRVKQSQDSFFQTLILTRHWSLQDHVSGFWKSEVYQREWNRVKSLFNIPKLLQVIDPYQIMSMVFKNDTEMWTTLYLNHIKKSGKRGDLFVPFLNFINKITTTVCSSLYKWAVNKNCMEGFLTERWDVRGMLKWVDQSESQESF